MADPILIVELIGNPVPQGSHRAFMPKGAAKPVIVENNDERLRDWRTEMKRELRDTWSASPLGPDPITGPVAVGLAFRMHRPANPKHRNYPASAPDIDKLARAVLDSLTQAKVIKDDGLVVQLNTTKVYDTPTTTPGVTIKLWIVEG